MRSQAEGRRRKARRETEGEIGTVLAAQARSHVRCMYALFLYERGGEEGVNTVNKSRILCATVLAVNVYALSQCGARFRDYEK